MNPNKPYITVAERKNLCKLNAALKTVDKHLIRIEDKIKIYHTLPRLSIELEEQVRNALSVISKRLIELESYLERYDAHKLLSPQWSSLLEHSSRLTALFSTHKPTTIDLSKDDVVV